MVNEKTDEDTTTIRITYGTKDKISARGKHGESYDTILLKLLKGKK